MLTLAETELRLPEGILLNQSFGSVFHGALISELDREWAEKMHEQQIRPYSQYLLVKEGNPYWRIAVLTEEAFDHILRPMMQKTSLFLEQKGYEVEVGKFSILKKDSFQGLEERFWTGTEKIHHIELDFLTSASFKKMENTKSFRSFRLFLTTWSGNGMYILTAWYWEKNGWEINWRNLCASRITGCIPILSPWKGGAYGHSGEIYGLAFLKMI